MTCRLYFCSKSSSRWWANDLTGPMPCIRKILHSNRQIFTASDDFTMFHKMLVRTIATHAQLLSVAWWGLWWGLWSSKNKEPENYAECNQVTYRDVSMSEECPIQKGFSLKVTSHLHRSHLYWNAKLVPQLVFHQQQNFSYRVFHLSRRQANQIKWQTVLKKTHCKWEVSKMADCMQNSLCKCGSAVCKREQIEGTKPFCLSRVYCILHVVYVVRWADLMHL